MLEAWKQQFSSKQLSLDYDKPIIFVNSQWQKTSKPSIIYLVYRWILAVTFSITLILSIVDLKHPSSAKWLIYLTHWGYICCTLQALLSALILSCVLVQSTNTSALKLYKPYWVLNSVSTVLAFGITSLYWSLIYDEKSMELDAMNFLVHANNSVLMMIDLFVVAHPVRLLHCCYPMLFGVCYALFSIIYYAAGGTSKAGNSYIYNILDWTKPGTTIAICIAVLGFILVLHIFYWGLYKFRFWIHQKFWTKKTNSEKQPQLGYFNEGLANDLV